MKNEPAYVMKCGWSLLVYRRRNCGVGAYRYNSGIAVLVFTRDSKYRGDILAVNLLANYRECELLSAPHRIASRSLQHRNIRRMLVRILGRTLINSARSSGIADIGGGEGFKGFTATSSTLFSLIVSYFHISHNRPTTLGKHCKYREEFSYSKRFCSRWARTFLSFYVRHFTRCILQTIQLTRLVKFSK